MIEGTKTARRVPLYKEAAELLGSQSSLQATANLGLYFDKFFDRWDKQEWKVAGPGKEAWLKDVAEKAARAGEPSSGGDELLHEAAQRLRALVGSLGGRVGELSTVGRFVPG
ncbi:MAG: hypothetical protein ACP5VR_13300, partial [Acidimicrobiales bacterium]